MTGFSADLDRLQAVADVDLQYMVDAAVGAMARLRGAHAEADAAFRGREYQGSERHAGAFVDTTASLETNLRHLQDNLETSAQAIREIVRRYRAADGDAATAMGVIGGRL